MLCVCVCVVCVCVCAYLLCVPGGRRRRGCRMPQGGEPLLQQPLLGVCVDAALSETTQVSVIKSDTGNRGIITTESPSQRYHLTCSNDCINQFKFSMLRSLLHM